MKREEEAALIEEATVGLALGSVVDPSTVRGLISALTEAQAAAVWKARRIWELQDALTKAENDRDRAQEAAERVSSKPGADRVQPPKEGTVILPKENQ